ncbi:hypothetical protein GW17_00037263 [Ensete ventricosum]|nr:hypothetical protein GW17_00037263 [Ensete ventricosum]RZR89427.1 hypothetical protein BHM03_00017162 [Ensete ventricosum]
MEKELNDSHFLLEGVQHQLKDNRARSQEMEDGLLKSVRAMDTLKFEMPLKIIEDYKESLGYKMGLQRTGQVSYEYEYRVALARFRAWYADLEIDEDPFIVLHVNDFVLMEAEQRFDDSLSLGS